MSLSNVDSSAEPEGDSRSEPVESASSAASVDTASRPTLDLFGDEDFGDEDFDEDFDEDVVVSAELLVEVGEDFDAGVESLFELDEDFDEVVVDEAASLVDADELDGPAYATPDAVAMPTPSATASAPTRPICLA
jgi:hypothetical protein